MKIAFFCEGFSEVKSVMKLLNKLNIASYQLSRSDLEPQGNYHGIYIVNGKNDGTILRDFEIKGKFLIDQYNYDYIIAWFDYNPKKPGLPNGIKAIKDSCDKTGYSKKKILLNSTKCLENWYLADIDTIALILSQNKLSREWKLFYQKVYDSTENFKDVEQTNVIPLLEDLCKITNKKKFDKIESAQKFFSSFSPEKVKGSVSFLSAIQILKKIFIDCK